MRQSTILIERYIRKGHLIGDIESFRKGMACLAEEIYPKGGDKVLSSGKLALLLDCKDLNNRNL